MSGPRYSRLSRPVSMLFPACDFRDLGRAIQSAHPSPRAPMTTQDDRTPEQQQTHTCGVLATDPGMSGWGKAANGMSLCVWACAPGVNVASVLAWVEGRSDMEDAQEIDLNDWEAPEGAAHVKIYVCNPGHPATLAP